MRSNIRLPLRSVFDIDVSETVVNMRILYIKMDKRCLDWRVPPILFLMIILFVGCGGAGRFRNPMENIKRVISQQEDRAKNV